MKRKRKRILRLRTAELVSSPNKELQTKLKEAREAGLRLPRVKYNPVSIYVGGIRGYDAHLTTGKGTLC